MRLYHTGNMEIKEPDIFRGRRNADFGQGFYLTPDREFTYRWAGNDAVVNEYELDLNGLNVHTFERDEEWFDYIFHNRRFNDTLSADVIIGPIANDTIFDTLGMISSGFLEPEEAVKLLMIGPVYAQAVVKSQKALQQLQWIRAERIIKTDEMTRKAEQDEYIEKFSEVLQEIVG